MRTSIMGMIVTVHGGAKRREMQIWMWMRASS